MKKDKPILFSGDMVKAILEGRKTQTRRVIKSDIASSFDLERDGRLEIMTIENQYGDHVSIFDFCPYGKTSEQLWIRETWRVGAWGGENEIAVDYRADDYCRKEWLDCKNIELWEKLVVQSIADAEDKAGLQADYFGRLSWELGESPCRWRPSIFMPRWASRIQLEIIDVRIERLQDISEKDCTAEGITRMDWEYQDGEYSSSNREAFKNLWDSINEKRGYGWDVNPWVWVVCFKRINTSLPEEYAYKLRELS